MRWFIKSLTKWWNDARMTDEERYLSASTDLIDLENRQRDIAYGKAPYQLQNRHWLDANNYN